MNDRTVIAKCLTLFTLLTLASCNSRTPLAVEVTRVVPQTVLVTQVITNSLNVYVEGEGGMAGAEPNGVHNYIGIVVWENGGWKISDINP